MFPLVRTFLPAALFLGLGLFLAIVSASALIGYAFCYLGGVQLLNAVSRHLPMPVKRVIWWTHAMTFEVFAFLGVAAFRLVPQRQSKPLGKGRPILLVHGYINSGSVWNLHKRKLEALGLGPIYTINLGHPFRSIATYAEKVRAKAEAIAKETGRTDLILIGHSMGGLVSAWYATQLAPPNTVTDVVTIASPLLGTPMARLGLGPNAREMEPNSPFIQQLQSAMASSKQIRFHHIATQSDQLVIPGASAAIVGNLHYILDDMGHASLLYSSRVTSKIAEWLKESVS